MSRRKPVPEQFSAKQRAALAFAGAAVMFSGLFALLQGKLHYQNYWHALVFAPFALLVGALCIFVAIKRR
jgi:hypothetical protein